MAFILVSRLVIHLIEFVSSGCEWSVLYQLDFYGSVALSFQFYQTYFSSPLYLFEESLWGWFLPGIDPCCQLSR
jgi:hypothetical protein